MTSPDIKRGGPFPNGLEQREARLLGPYPTWKSWRHIAEERFDLNLRDSHNQYEPQLHAFYVLRRLQQKAGAIDPEAMQKFWSQMARQAPNFEEECTEALRFIVDNIPIKPK